MSDLGLTRRAALVGAFVSSAALVAPAVGAIRDPDLPAADPRRIIDALISAHRDAYTGFDRIYRQFDALRDRVDLPAVRVAYGSRRHANGERSTLYAYTVKQLRLLADDLWGIHSMLGLSPAQIEQKRRDWLAPRVAELRDANRRRARLYRSSGLAQLLEARGEAEAVERQLRLALLAHRPVDQVESDLKAQYLSISPPFTDRWADVDPTFLADLVLELGRSDNLVSAR